MTDNPLTRFLQSLPEKVRLAIYALLFLAGVVYAALQATDGDWGKAITLLVASVLGGAMPASNTQTVKARRRDQRGTADAALVLLVLTLVGVVLLLFRVHFG